LSLKKTSSNVKHKKNNMGSAASCSIESYGSCCVKTPDSFYDLSGLDLQTGDIVLFGKNGPFSRLIAAGTDSKYSHVGMVLKEPIYLDPSLKGTYLLEAITAVRQSDQSSNVSETICGVHLSPIQQTMGKTRKVAFRRLVIDRNEAFYDKLKQAYESIKDAKFDTNPIHWLMAKWVHDRQDDLNSLATFRMSPDQFQKLNSLYCSALVAYLFVSIDIIPK
jgi:hypothetical protein